MDLQHNQVSSNSVYEVIPTHTKGYHCGISHMQPSYLLVFSGRRHKQYILNEVFIALYNVCLVLTEGNTVILSSITRKENVVSFLGHHTVF